MNNSHLSIALVLQELKRLKVKITRARKGIIEVLASQVHLVKASDLISLLEQQGISVNKSTVYRELKFLVHHNIISENTSQPTAVYYELAHQSHHHHFICLTCGKSRSLPTVQLEKALQLVEQTLQESGVIISHHSLEFFGTCQECQNQ